MKAVVVFSVVALAIVSAGVLFSSVQKNRTVPRDVVELYARWKKEHNKLYATPAESSYRLEVFYEQKQFVDRSNQEYAANAEAAGQTLSGPMFELNAFGDLSEEEFKARYAGARLAPAAEAEEAPELARAAPVSESGTGLGALAANGEFEVRIRNQGGCASCWAFSAVACTERLHWQKAGTQLDFSPQELVDCEDNSEGCIGGFPEDSYGYMEIYGITLLTDYPYIGAQGACRRKTTPHVKVGVRDAEFRNFDVAYANKLAEGGRWGNVLVFAAGKFRYIGKGPEPFDGKLAGDCGKTVDHAITMIDAANDELTVLNQWGNSWGNGGIKKMKACSNSNLYGSQGRIAHPYGKI